MTMNQPTEDGHVFVPITQPVISEPFSITLYSQGKYVKVQFKKSEDILKLGEVLSKFLTQNGIENTIEYK